MHYRQIYKQHYGEIPKDKDGRSYEIHHIDGNHSNDSLENLIAVTIQEHYDIHYSQGDWAACFRIGAKMKLSPKELSELSKRTQQRQIDNGTHVLMKRPDGTSVSSDRVANGTHLFLDGEFSRKIQKQRVDDGTHHFLGGEIQRNSNLRRVANGTNPFQTRSDGSSLSSDRINDGSHHFLTNNPSKNLQEVTCPYCNKTGKGNAMKQHHFDNCKKRIK